MKNYARLPNLYIELLKELLELKNLQISAMKLSLSQASGHALLDKLASRMDTYSKEGKEALDKFSQNIEKLIAEHAAAVANRLSKDPRSAKLELSSAFIAKELQEKINEIRSLRSDLSDVLSEFRKKFANTN